MGKKKKFGYKPKAIRMDCLTSKQKEEVISSGDCRITTIGLGRHAREHILVRVPKYEQKTCDTDLEMIVEKILIDLGYKEMRDYKKQFPACGYVLDFAFPTIKLAIEPGAGFWHGNIPHAVNHKKDALLRREGWEILWYDEDDLKDEESVEDEIRMAIQNLGYIQ